MAKLKYSLKDVWVHHGYESSHITPEGWGLWVREFTISSPEALAGRRYFAYSYAAEPKNKDRIWRHKDPRARIFERHFFLDHAEAKEAGLRAVTDIIAHMAHIRSPLKR